MTRPAEKSCAQADSHVYVNPLRMACDARFYFWAMLLLGGFLYVYVVLCGRTMPRTLHHRAYMEILKLLISAPILFYLSPRYALQPFVEDCRRALTWNVLGFALPYFIALHFFYLQKIHVVNYSLTASDFQRMPFVAIIVFSILGLVILLLAGYHMYLAQQEGVLLRYMFILFAAIGLIAAITWAVRSHHHLHIHHYFLAGFFIPFTRFRNPVSVVCLGLSAGVYVEGISEWGMDPIWV